MKKLNIFIENNLLFIIAIFSQILNVVIYLSIKNYNFETFKILNIIILLSASLTQLYKNGDYNFKYMYIFFFVYFVIFFYINFSFENKDTTLLILSRLILPISFLFYLSYIKKAPMLGGKFYIYNYINFNFEFFHNIYTLYYF